MSIPMDLDCLLCNTDFTFQDYFCFFLNKYLFGNLLPFKGTIAWDFFFCMNSSRPDVKRFWFWNFWDAPSILESHFKFWCGSYQSFSNKFYLYCKLLRDTLMFLKNILRKAWTHESPRGIYTSAAFLGDSLTKDPWKLEDRRISWQSFSEILGNSELKMSVSNRMNIFEILKLFRSRYSGRK